MQRNSETKYLVRKQGRVDNKGNEKLFKSHIWLSEKNNTMCNMYPKGNFNKDKWEVLDMWKVGKCNMCMKHRRKHGGKDTPKNISE